MYVIISAVMINAPLTVQPEIHNSIDRMFPQKDPSDEIFTDVQTEKQV